MIGPAVAVPEVTLFTESPADNTEPPVLSVNPEASAGEVPVLETFDKVLVPNPSGVAGVHHKLLMKLNHLLE